MCRIEGRVVITEEEEKKIITEALEENDITVSYSDPKLLQCFTIQVEALFACHDCDNAWSSHMATIKIDLFEREVNRSDCHQRCKKCPESWISPKMTEDRFKEAVDRVITKYWERKKKTDEDDKEIDNDQYSGNPQAPHEQSLCKRCIKLGRPCW